MLHVDEPAGVRSRIAYFRVVEPDYPRNRRIRTYLRKRGHDVIVVPPAVEHGRVANHIADFFRLLKSVRRGDTIIVAEQYMRAAPIAAVVARLRACRLVVDGFVGIHETAVEDWKVAEPGSLLAARFRLQDHFARKAADCLLIDTDVRADALRASAALPSRVMTLPVGAPSWARTVGRAVTRSTDARPLRVLYYGNYIPLHGLDVVLGALARTTMPVQLTLIGDGDGRPAIESMASRLAISDRVTFRPPVPEQELTSLIADHDVVLGVFGCSPKAGSVVANKVWQGLACGRLVITRTSPALDELRPLAGDMLRAVEPSEQALAAELDRVARDGVGSAPADLAERLEAYVAARFEEFGTWLDGAN